MNREYGSLTKRDIVKKLNLLGFEVKSVHQLNLILEKMGIIKHCNNGWKTTQAGSRYSTYTYPGFDDDLWNSDLLRDVWEYLKSIENE